MLLTLTGCALVPRERSQQSTLAKREITSDVRAFDVSRHLVSETPTITMPPIAVRGASNVVSVTLTPPRVETVTHQAATNAAAANQVSTEAERSTVTIPLFVKLIGGAVGLALLLAVIFGGLWLARRHSLAAAAALDTADGELAKIIGSIEARLHTATDGEKVSALSQLNDLNKTRGKLALQRKAK